MKTHNLIATLATDTHRQAGVGQRLWRAGPAGFGAAMLAIVLLWGLRADLGAALASTVVLKTLAPLVLAGAAAVLALSMARPAVPVYWRAMGLAVVAGLILLVLVAGLPRAGGAGAGAVLLVPQLWVCLLSVPLLSLPFLVAALWSLAAGAVLRPALTGAVAGLAAGGAGAAVYSLYCDQDAALFVLPAYGAAILGMAALGAVAGARALRW